MERKRNLIQVYAIIVNVVAIITFIISLSSLVSALIDRSDPIYVETFSKVDLSSFEKYKLDVLNTTEQKNSYVPDDDTIRQMYEDAKSEKINKVNHQSLRSIVVSSLIMIIAIILFAFHWWLAKKFN